MYAHPISNGMRLMGIDFGSKRVGIALSNEGGNMAFPREVIPNDRELLGRIVHIIQKEKVGKVVVGYSQNRVGGANPIQERITDLIQDLTLELPIPIELEPELYTTQEAMRIQGKTKDTDASAAAIILNSYITRHTS